MARSTGPVSAEPPTTTGADCGAAAGVDGDEASAVTGADSNVSAVVVLEVLFWLSLAALVWTHVGYPLFVALVARIHPRPVAKGHVEPTVTVVVAAHDEEAVIVRRLENLLALDYPAAKLEILVASDGSTDRTDELVGTVAGATKRVRLLRCPRAGKVAAQNRAVGETTSEVVAFTDANARWHGRALRELVGNFADPAVAYVCGRLRLEPSGGTNREGVYWRFELWVRGNESAVGSITAGNGGIYAVRRSDYIANDPRIGHDLGLPYQLTQRGRRAVYDSDAVAWEKPSRDLEDEYERKVRMQSQCWQHVLSGRMLRGGRVSGLLYLFQIVSHRLLRYGSGLLHLLLLITSIALVGQALIYVLALAVQLAWLLLAAAGRLKLPVPGAGLAYYYVLVTLATLTGLVRYLRVGVPVVWEKAEGTR
jgi:cellulose synthase/poly-beta-1,6-N-acetylglucosamine synthase-like glycosyltransferase